MVSEIVPTASQVGAFSQARIYSRYVAAQMAAIEAGCAAQIFSDR